MTGPVPVTVATATKGSIGVYQDAIGTVTPVYTATITAQASGVITKVDYREGQFVHKGDALIEIDPRQQQAAVASLRATERQKKALYDYDTLEQDRQQKGQAERGIHRRSDKQHPNDDRQQARQQMVKEAGPSPAPEHADQLDEAADQQQKPDDQRRRYRNQRRRTQRDHPQQHQANAQDEEPP